MKTSLRTFAAVALLTGLTLTGCATSVTTEDTTDTGTREITDVLGNVVEIPAEVDAIASTYPAVEQIFLLLGAEDRAVAVNTTNTTNELLLELAPVYADLPVIFETGGDFDAEALLAADPDVVITTSQDYADAIAEVGIPAVVAMATSVDRLKETVNIVGEILGTEDRAQELIEYYEGNMQQATDRTDALSDDERTRVYYATGNGPLNTEAKGSIVTDWIEMAGGLNVATEAGVEGMFIEISAEELLSWDPEVIMCTSVASCDEFRTDAVFAGITAVQNGAVYPAPKGTFVWSVRSAEEATMTLWAATKIQPEMFADIDYVQVTKDFYEQFYGYTLTDEQVATILNPPA